MPPNLITAVARPAIRALMPKLTDKLLGDRKLADVDGHKTPERLAKSRRSELSYEDCTSSEGNLPTVPLRQVLFSSVN